MPYEKFPVLDTWEKTVKLWSRKLEYLVANLDDDNVSITIDGITGLTAASSELNILDGAVITTVELNKLSGAGAVVASGTEQSKINDPAGGATVDSEARTAINSIIDALEAFNISST